MAQLLELSNLQCVRDDRVLFTGLNFQLKPGDIVQVEGPNGAGKTTLLRSVLQFLPLENGEVLWNGSPVNKCYYDFCSQLIHLGHAPGIKKTLTARENLIFLMNLGGGFSIQAIDEALEKVGLLGYEDVLGYQLSAGQGRRIALARLYLTQARLWVLDEPFTSLDVVGIERLEQLFKAHLQKGGMILLTSHQPLKSLPVQALNINDYLPLPEESFAC